MSNEVEVKPKNKGGRPSIKDEIDMGMLERLVSFGLTDVDIARIFRVNECTINRWKKDPKVMQALKKGKDVADAQVERSLFERAMGYSHTSEEIHVIKGQVVRVPIIKHYPPDTVAQIFWLKNRQSGQWRDRQEVEHGGSIELNLSGIVSNVKKRQGGNRVPDFTRN